MTTVPDVPPQEPWPVEVPASALKRPCDVCAELIDRAAKKCSKCDSWQNGKPCRLCAVWMPTTAVRCGACDAFQDWRGRLPGNALILSLVVSLLSVLGTAIPAVVDLINLPADTSAMYLETKLEDTIDPTKQAMAVWVLNGGGSSAIVRSGKLHLPHAKPVELEVGNVLDSEVPAKKKTTIRFAAERVEAVSGCAGGNILAALATQPSTLEIEVDERNRFGNFVRRDPPVKTIIPAGKLQAWLRDKIDVGTTLEGCP